jgi:ribosome maturation factor RimP
MAGDGVSMADLARITEIVEAEVKVLGFELVRVILFGKTEVGDEEHTLQIMAERPETGQLVLEDCAALSHRISDRIDDLEDQGIVLIEEAYRLEVSSPGIDRPLTRFRDFTDWAGHEAKVSLVTPVDGNRKALQGELVGTEGDETILFDDKKSGRLALTLADIHSAKLVLTDRLIAASRPQDMTGVDDIEDEDAPEEIRALQQQED